MMITCPLCGSAQTTGFGRHPEAAQDMRHCRACGFYFVYPHEPWIPSVTDGVDAATFEFWGNPAAHAAYAYWRAEENDRVAAFVVSEGPYRNLLEIGYGEGPLTRRLLKHVREYWGIEPVPNHYSRTIETLNLSKDHCLCIQAETMLDDPRLANIKGTLDAIVMISVFEHLSHPREVLAACNSLLRPGGRLFISTPDSTYFPFLTVLRRFGQIEPWSRFHISFFSRGCLDAAFSRAGFSVASLQSYTLLTKASIDYYKKLKNSFLLGLVMTVFRALRFDRLFRVSTLFYCLVKDGQ